MTHNRMGSTRRSIHRKAWVTGTLALGVVAATGAVASAHHTGAPTQKFSLASEKGEHEKKESSRDEGRKHEAEKGGSAQKAQGPQGLACLKLDSRARKAISEAGAKEGTTYVPLDKVEVVPCPAPQGEPRPAPVQPAPIQPAPVPVKPAPVQPAPAPAPVQPAPPVKPAPVPHVTTSAS